MKGELFTNQLSFDCTGNSNVSLLTVRSWLIHSPCKDKPMVYSGFNLNGYDLDPLFETNSNKIEEISYASNTEEPYIILKTTLRTRKRYYLLVRLFSRGKIFFIFILLS